MFPWSMHALSCGMRGHRGRIAKVCGQCDVSYNRSERAAKWARRGGGTTRVCRSLARELALLLCRFAAAVPPTVRVPYAWHRVRIFHHSKNG